MATAGNDDKFEELAKEFSADLETGLEVEVQEILSRLADMVDYWLYMGAPGLHPSTAFSHPGLYVRGLSPELLVHAASTAAVGLGMMAAGGPDVELTIAQESRQFLEDELLHRLNTNQAMQHQE